LRFCSGAENATALGAARSDRSEDIMNWDLILNEYLAWSIAAIAFFSFLAVSSWVNARRKEREAFYKSEAIRKIAEMPTAPPEPVLNLLRDAVASWKESGQHMGPVQAKAFYRSETLRKIAEIHGAGADSLIAFLREEDQMFRRRQRQGMQLGGLICVGVGIAISVMLWIMVPSPPNPPTYPVGLIPLLVGLVLLIYSRKMGSQQ
jgi:hypothetical protein